MASGNLPYDVFERHLDLRPLRGRRRGVVRCIFHSDRSPSLSVDLDAGVFHCFGCGVQGGLKRFAELVGESSARSRPARYEWLGPLAEARRNALTAERAAQDRRAAFQPIMDAAAGYCRVMRDVVGFRAVATAADPNRPDVWELLEHAAWLEADVLLDEYSAHLAVTGRYLW